MARKFEKISFDQFRKDVCDDMELYQNFPLPKRGTKESAGYDFFSLEEFVLLPGKIKKIPLGVKVDMNPFEMLMLVVRSSQGFKYNVRMCNQIGIFERDYYNNIDNEGHMWLKIQNHGEKEYVVHIGDKICQGIFTSFLTVDDEEEILEVRKGGFGSTDRKEENTYE